MFWTTMVIFETTKKLNYMKQNTFNLPYVKLLLGPQKYKKIPCGFYSTKEYLHRCYVNKQL